MKVKARVILDYEEKKVVGIQFKNDLLNTSAGIGPIKSFIRRRVLNQPMEKFVIRTVYPGDPKQYHTINMELDVYMLIKHIVEPSSVKRIIPYRCKLSPIPITKKTSDITFEEYEELHNKAVNPSSISLHP
jgi:hypothetical protein